jgi:hypothetical protein
MNNPYTSRGPLHDPKMFFGRMHDLNEVGAFLCNNQSVSIIGPRKIGKTSLLLHLMRTETMEALRIGKENLYVYNDCQAISSGEQNNILAHFCTEIATALHTYGLEPEPALKAAVSDPTRLSFESALRKLNQRGLRVALILDEFEQLTMNPFVDVNFYNALRSAAGRLRLVFITASSRPLIELTYSERSQKILSSPFFNIFAPLFLGLLSETDARNLIRIPMEAAGIDVRPQLESFIYELAGGHPLALQIACYHAWESPDDLSQIELQTTQELEAHFQYYWHNLSSLERNVLRQPAEASLREAHDPAIRIIFRSLVQKCLLMQMHDSYNYPSKAWAEFVLAQLHDPVTISPTETPVEVRTGDSIEQNGLVEEHQKQVFHRNGWQTMKRTIRGIIRESLPETIGGLIVAVVLGLVGLIYSQFPQLIEIAKSIYARIGLTWLVLAILGFLAVGITVTRVTLRRKRGK